MVGENVASESCEKTSTSIAEVTSLHENLGLSLLIPSSDEVGLMMH